MAQSLAVVILQRQKVVRCVLFYWTRGCFRTTLGPRVGSRSGLLLIAHEGWYSATAYQTNRSLCNKSTKIGIHID